MNRFKKIFLWFTVFLVLLLLSLHLVITYRSGALVSKVVNELSDGNYTATTQEVSFQYFPAGISISGLSVQPTADTGKLFYIKSKQIDLQLTSIVALLMDKKMGVSLLHVQDPEIVVTGKSNDTDEKKSLPESIRDIQQGLFNTFSLLKVKDASINNGSIRVQIDPRPEQYFAINHVQLDLKNIVLEPDADNDGIPEFDGNVVIALKTPDIHFANPSLELQLGMLKASSANHALVIDSMRFRYAKGNEQVDTINLEKIKINNLNWNKFLKEGNFELDSVIVATGKTTLNFFQQDQPEKNVSASKNNGLYNGPSFLVHHLAVSNISYKLTTQEWIQSKEDRMEVNFKGDSLWLKDLSITSGKKPAVDVEALRINFTNYSDANEQKTYAASLGAMEVSNNTLVLKNYSIQALQGSQFSKGNKVVLPELRLQGYSLEDLFLRRLIADKLVINKPEVVIDILQQKRTGPKKEINKEVKEFLADFSKKVSLNEVEVKDASLILRPKKIPGDDIVISGLSINVDGRRALAADSITDILQAVTRFSTEGFRIKSRDMDLVVSEMKMLKDRGLYFGTVQGKFGSNVNVNLRGVTILNRNFSFDVTSENGLHVSDLMVEGGTVDVSLNAVGSTKKAGMNLPAVITADHVQLSNIIFRIQQEGKVGAGSALDISATNLSLVNGAATWDKLLITGNKNEAIIGEANFKAGSMTIEQPGNIALTTASGNLRLKHAQIHFETQKLLMGLSLSSTNIPELRLKQVLMQQPNIDIEVYEPDSSSMVKQITRNANTKDITLESLQLNDANIQFKLYKKNKEELINAKTFQGNVLMHDLSLLHGEYAPAVRIANILFETNKVETAIVKEFFTPGSLHLKASNMLADLGTKRVTMQVDSLRLTDISQQFFGKKADTFHLHLGELGIADFPFSNTDSMPWKSILLNKKWWTNGSHLQYHTPNEMLTIDGLRMKNDQRLSFVFDSLLWEPRLNREDFWKSEPYENDHLRLWLGKTSSENVKWKMDGELPDISMSKLMVHHMALLAQRDKTRPEDTLTYRPLLAKQISNIGIPLRIDTLKLLDGKITYNEIVQKTKLPSDILFDRIQGNIYHIKTHAFEENDSLFIAVQAKLYGKGNMQLHFRQSYTDTLQGFLLHAHMGSFDMKEMNAMLLPQLGLRIKSGEVDSLNMLVQGNKYFAYGTMDIRYQHFKVGLVGKSGSEKYFLSGVKNWLVNVVLRGHDNGKPNLLLKERVQKRGQFNYWGKIAIEGLLSNIGLKSNRAERKSLQKQKRIYQMPTDYMEKP